MASIWPLRTAVIASVAPSNETTSTCRPALLAREGVGRRAGQDADLPASARRAWAVAGRPRTRIGPSRGAMSWSW